MQFLWKADDASDPAGAINRPMVSTVTATTLAVADMVGVGVFTSLGFQVQDIPSAFSLLMLWILGGVIALCGALSYAELAAALPRSGGEYYFLSCIYHPAVGFLAGWTSMTVGFAAPTALAAMAFGSYAAGIIPSVPPIVLALAVTGLVTLVHIGGVRQGTVFQNVATNIKIGLVAVLMIAGFASGGAGQVDTFAPTWRDLHYMTSAPFAISLVFVMYSYSGWNAATYIAGDIRRPHHSLPLSVIGATLIVLVLYTGLNAAFLYSTPMSRLSGQLDVALVVGRNVFGESGGRLVSALICFGLVSSISAMMWIGPRVTAIVGEDVALLRPLARHSRKGVPIAALCYQAAVVVLLLLTGSFETILDFMQFSLTLCSFLAVLGVIVLRHRYPSLPRPYRLPGYPFVPLVFLAMTGFMLVHLVLERPLQSLAGLAMMLVGLAIYAVSGSRVGEPSFRGGV
jgi:basic amino acid/polyamine antiporter, APA family